MRTFFALIPALAAALPSGTTYGSGSGSVSGSVGFGFSGGSDYGSSGSSSSNSGTQYGAGSSSGSGTGYDNGQGDTAPPLTPTAPGPDFRNDGACTLYKARNLAGTNSPDDYTPIPSAEGCLDLNSLYGVWENQARSLTVHEGYKCDFYTSFECPSSSTPLCLIADGKKIVKNSLPAAYDKKIQSVRCVKIPSSSNPKPSSSTTPKSSTAPKPSPKPSTTPKPASSSAPAPEPTTTPCTEEATLTLTVSTPPPKPTSTPCTEEETAKPAPTPAASYGSGY